jgi:hypothetical protein
MMDGGMLFPRIDRVDGDDDTVRWMHDDAEDRLNALLDGGEYMDDILIMNVGDTIGR